MSSNPARNPSTLDAIGEFLKLEAASGVILVVAGALAMIAANTFLAEGYNALLQVQFRIQLGAFELDKPLVVWVNDLLLAGAAFAVLFALNRLGVMRIAPYILVGTVLWVCVLKSGVHATLAGVVAALFVPARDPVHPDHPPLRTLEHALHPWVAFGILPVFAFANAGVSLAGLSLGVLAGSLISAVAGYAVLHLVLLRPQGVKR